MTRGLIRRDPGELPAEVTGFVGRQRELAVLDGLLGTARLVTVTGPGGVGKTRVALRAAARSRGQFADGVYLAELGGLHDPDLLPHTIATCLGLPGQEAGSQVDAIVDYLRGRRLLLILDSCEHLIGACAALAEPVLRYAPQVTILATSRQPMNVPGEHCCPVPPLPVPGLEASQSGASQSGAGRGASACSRPAAGGPCRTSRRCVPRRNGATTSARRSGCSGHGCRYSPGRSSSLPPRPSARAGRWPARTSCPP